jgi:Tfp pilus assembly protein PilF
LKKAIKLNPNWDIPYKLLAEYDISQKNYARAIHSLRTVLKINPKDKQSQLKLAKVEELHQKEVAASFLAAASSSSSSSSSSPSLENK